MMATNKSHYALVWLKTAVTCFAIALISNVISQVASYYSSKNFQKYCDDQDEYYRKHGKPDDELENIRDQGIKLSNRVEQLNNTSVVFLIAGIIISTVILWMA
jgi:hypothetical protein